MVERDDIPVIRTSNQDNENENSTYSMKKEKKTANIQIEKEQAVNGGVDNGDFKAFVDSFVQYVIERAKQEYLGSCANGGVETRVREENGEDRLHTGKLCYLFLKPRQLSRYI